MSAAATHIVRIAHAGVRTVEPDDAKGRAEKGRNPLRRHIACIEAANMAAPHDDVVRDLLGSHARQYDSARVGRGQRQAAVFDAGFDQDESGLLALRDEATVAIDYHPLAVADAVRGESGDVNVGARKRDAAAALDRINVESADPSVVQFRSPAM